MRVLQLISSGGHYGAENMLLFLCKALERLGCQPIVGIFRNSQVPNVETMEHARRLGLEVEVFDCKGKVDWSTVRAIQSSIGDCRIDLIHTHGYKADIYGFAAARGLRVPLVATCHSWPDRHKQSPAPLRFYGLLDQLILRHFQKVVAVSSDLAILLRQLGIPRQRITTITNGVSMAAFASASPTFAEEIGKGKRTVVGMIARLVPAKGPCFFLRAAQGILKEFPQTLFVLIGDGPERGRLVELAHELKIETNLIIVGQRHDMPGIYASLDMIVLPSASEGMPMVILEALAAGKPVVATRVGAVPTVVLPGQTGLLVEPGDCEGLQGAIAKLLAAPELRRQLGANGQAWVSQHHSAEVMAQSYLSVYQQALGKVAAA